MPERATLLVEPAKEHEKTTPRGETQKRTPEKRGTVISAPPKRQSELSSQNGGMTSPRKKRETDLFSASAKESKAARSGGAGARGTKVLRAPRRSVRQTPCRSNARGREVRRTIAMKTVTNATVEATCAVQGFLLWACASTLEGNEDWVDAAVVRALLRQTLYSRPERTNFTPERRPRLRRRPSRRWNFGANQERRRYPLSPPAIRSATRLAAAALERVAAHPTFAKLISMQPGAVAVLRALLERDALADVQCRALRVLQAILEVAKPVRDELVVQDFRSFLAGRLLERRPGPLEAKFATLGAHMLATITKLGMAVAARARARVGDTSAAQDRRRTLARASQAGLATYDAAERRPCALALRCGSRGRHIQESDVAKIQRKRCSRGRETRVGARPAGTCAPSSRYWKRVRRPR